MSWYELQEFTRLCLCTECWESANVWSRFSHVWIFSEGQAVQVMSTGPLAVQRPEGDSMTLGCRYRTRPTDTGELDIEWSVINPDPSQKNQMVRWCSEWRISPPSWSDLNELKVMMMEWYYQPCERFNHFRNYLDFNFNGCASVKFIALNNSCHISPFHPSFLNYYSPFK